MIALSAASAVLRAMNDMAVTRIDELTDSIIEMGKGKIMKAAERKQYDRMIGQISAYAEISGWTEEILSDLRKYHEAKS